MCFVHAQVSKLRSFNCFLAADSIPSELNISAVGVDDNIVIGQDCTETYPCQLNADLDDFIIFDHALSAEEVAELRGVYSSIINN